MWTILQETPTYSIIFSECKCKYQVFITDYIKIWEVCYTDEEFLARLQESNSKLDMIPKELIEKGKNMLDNKKEKKIVNLKISHNDLLLTVEMTDMLSRYPVHLKIILNQGSNELFFQRVTQSLLKTIKDLRSSERELSEIIKQKDDEIEEYITIGGKIRYTALPPFNEKVHMSKHSEYTNNFGDKVIPNYLLEKTIEIPGDNEKNVDVNSKRTIKKEPESQEITKMPSILTQIKQECIKTELKPLSTRSKRKKTLNL